MDFAHLPLITEYLWQIPGLSDFIRDMVHANIGPMMYDPNIFTLNLEQLLSGAPLDAAIGVIQVTVHAARGLKYSRIGGGSPDPYVSITINNRGELARTKYRQSTLVHSHCFSHCLLIVVQVQPDLGRD